MVEVQSHGFTFEKWVRDNFFAGYTGSYMQKWDIPSEANTQRSVPTHFQRIPVSIKTAKFGSPIGLGDVLRQRQIDTDFLMIVGFWRQRTASEKWIEEIGVVHFPSVKWLELWGQVSLEHLREIDAVIKDMTHGHTIARQQAKAWKSSLAEILSSKLVINPKIDSKSQRRIQCSLPFSAFWSAAGREPTPTDHPSLFGVEFNNPIISSARKFSA